MRHSLATLVLAFAAACGGGGGTSPDATTVAPRCQPTASFQPAVAVAGLNTNLDDVSARFSADELFVTFSRKNMAGVYDLYTATRTSIDTPFDAPTLILTVNSASSDASPAVSPDALLLVFDSDRATGVYHMYTSHRASTSDVFGPPSLALALMDREGQPSLANGHALYFASDARTGLGARDIWRAEIDTTGAMSTPMSLAGGVNSTNDESAPAVSADERNMYFRRTIGTESDIYRASRASAQDGFGPAATVEGLATPAVDETPDWVSPDGCHLYFHSNAPGGVGGYDLYLTSRG
jgi:Tol biopolymer transport system component